MIFSYLTRIIIDKNVYIFLNDVTNLKFHKEKKVSYLVHSQDGISNSYNKIKIMKSHA